MSARQQLDDLEAVRKVIEALDGFDAKVQERILKWAREKMGLGPESTDSGILETKLAPPPGTPAAAGGSTTDIRTFIETKNPATDNQFAAAVAYYYRFEAPPELRKDSITAPDLQEACRQANRNRMNRPAQVLINAHGQGLFNRGDRGTYALNTVGENLVAMTLPPDGSKAQARPSRKPAKAKPSPQKAARKTQGATKSNIAKKKAR